MPATDFACREGRRPAGPARDRAARRSRPADDGVQFVPVLRGALRGVSRHGDAPRISGRRPELSRQPLPFLRRLLCRLPVLAAARVRRERAARAGAGARGILCGLCVAAGAGAAVRAQWPRGQPGGGAQCRGVHPRLRGVARCGRAVRHPHRAGRVLPADAAQRDGGAVRRGVPLCDRRAGDGPARVLARYRRSGLARRGLVLAGDPRSRTAALSRWRRHRLLQPR